MNMNNYIPYGQYQYSMNPYSQYQNQAQQPTMAPQSLIRVNGIEGAKAYQMGANSVVALFDGNEDYMYIKTTDGAGFPTVRTFRFEEVTNKPLSTSPDYISRDEFERFKEEVLANGKFTIQQSQPQDA